MVNSSDLRVQGWLVSEDGGTIGDITDINIADISSSSRATSEVGIGANLDSTSETRFVLDDYNNQIVVDGVTVILNAGTYTGVTLAEALEERIDVDGLTVNYSPVTGKFTFANAEDTPAGPAIDLEMDAEESTIREILGFDPATVPIADGSSEISGTPRLTDKLFYVNNNNNTISFTVGGTDYQATIPVIATPYTTQMTSTGPSTTSIAVAVETALNGAGSGATFTVFYDDTTGKFTIGSDTAARINWEAEETSAEQLLGFASEFDENNTATVTSFEIAAGGNIESVYSPNTVFDSAAVTYSTALNVYDSLGSPHTITLYFKKVASNNWEWYAAMSSEDLDNGIPSSDGTSQPMMVGGGGTLEFNPNGSLKSVSGSDDVYFNFAGGADLLQPINIDFGTSTSEGGSGLDGTTQYANASATFSQSQDGFPAGALSGVSVGSEGLISGVFSNGEIKPLAQLALGMFQSPWGLVKEGNNLWAETVESGNVSIGLPKTAGRGEIAANSLEQSNVDIATEFVRMISAQRAFQANARMITTSDELLTEVVNLKR